MFTVVARYSFSFIGKKLPFKWENAMTIDRESWGYRSEANSSAYISSAKLIETLIETVR